MEAFSSNKDFKELNYVAVEVYVIPIMPSYQNSHHSQVPFQRR
jgi:hypothetical protein